MTVKQLESAPDDTLISFIKNDDPLQNLSISTLSRRYEKLIASMINRFSPSRFSQLDRSSVSGNKELFVFRAAKSFDPNRGVKFGSHLSNEVKFASMNSKKEIPEEEIPLSPDAISFIKDKYDEDSLEEDLLNIEEVMPFIDREIDSIADQRTRTVIRMRYFSNDKKNLCWREVGKEIGLTYQAAQNIHDNFLKKLKKHITKKYAKKI